MTAATADPLGEVVWGIIGCGDVTEVKSGPALRQVPGSRLAAVMRRDGAKAADYARRHRVPRWYDDAAALIADPEVNAVYVATPPDSHREFTVAALGAGKAVLVEKPMAARLADCEAMVAEAEAAGRPLFVAYYRRSLPRFEKMRALIQEGAIGTPRCVAVKQLVPVGDCPAERWKVEPAVNGGGLFIDVQTHVLDWLDHVFGPALGVSGEIARVSEAYPAEDLVAYTLRFAGGLIASGLCCYAADRREDSVTVHGDAGEVSMSFLTPGPVVLRRGAEERHFDLPDPAHVHQPFIAAVVAQLRGGPPAPCLGADGLRTSALCHELYGGSR